MGVRAHFQQCERSSVSFEGVLSPVREVTRALIRIAYSGQVHTQSLSLWLQMADLINADSW